MTARPRIRTLKPEMWADEKIGTLSRDARLLFVGLITAADDDGRLRAMPAAVIGHCFPYDNDVTMPELDQWLGEIEAVGLIVRYDVDGVPYIELCGWSRHQRINRPSPSILPPPPGAFTEDSVSAHGEITDRSLKAHALARGPARARIGSGSGSGSGSLASDVDGRARASEQEKTITEKTITDHARQLGASLSMMKGARSSGDPLDLETLRREAELRNRRAAS